MWPDVGGAPEEWPKGLGKGKKGVTCQADGRRTPGNCGKVLGRALKRLDANWMSAERKFNQEALVGTVDWSIRLRCVSNLIAGGGRC